MGGRAPCTKQNRPKLGRPRLQFGTKLALGRVRISGHYPGGLTLGLACLAYRVRSPLCWKQPEVGKGISRSYSIEFHPALNYDEMVMGFGGQGAQQD